MRVKNLDPITKAGRKKLGETKTKLQETLGISLTEKTIWKTLKSPKIRRNIADFLWKLLYGRLRVRVGVYWKNIPSYEEKVNCKYCGGLETMDCSKITEWRPNPLLEPVRADSPGPNWTEAWKVGLWLQLMCCTRSVIQPWGFGNGYRRKPKIT
jgi:hypothetical protein